MKRLFIELALLSFSVVAVIAALEIYYADYVTGYDTQANKFYAQKEHVDLLVVGNSHTAAIQDGWEIDSLESFNFSSGYLDLYHMYTILKKVVSVATIEKAIVGVDYDMLGYNMVANNSSWKDRQLYSFTGELYNNTLSNKIMANSNFFHSNRDLSYLFTPKKEKQEEVTLNFLLNTVKTGDWCEKKALEHSVYTYDEAHIAENKRYLQQIVNLCKGKNIALTFITLPKRNCYRKAYKNEVVNKGRECMEEIVNGHEAVYIDLFDYNFPDQYFHDADHLNPDGVNYLMQVITNRSANE